MSETDSQNTFNLIPYPTRDLAVPQTGPNRILGEMVGVSLALATEFVTPVDLDSLVQEGKALYSSNEWTDANWQAIELFRRAAEAGHNEAQFLMFKCSRHLHRVLSSNADGFTLDKTEPFDWLRKSAESGFAEAEHRLGLCYRQGKGVAHDYADAFKWFRRAAEQGRAGAQALVGDCYRDGVGVTKDYVEAVNWYRKAALQGNAMAQNDVGVYLISFRGDGMDFSEDRVQEYKEGIEWLHQAAKQGQRLAQWTLGYYYHHGSGRIPISPSKMEAYKWLQLAADQGHQKAKEFLSALAALMSPAELKAAEHLYREFKATQKGRQ